MKLVVISRPDFFPNEEFTIELLLEGGADAIHIRKPNAKPDKVSALLDKIDKKYYPKLVLNGYHQLLDRYNLGGIHLNSKDNEPPEGYTGSVGFSCHTIEELASKEDEMDYCFLSPIYDSISKTGYSAGFSHHNLAYAASRGIINQKVIALGGITPERIAPLKCYNFGGIAVLGYIWNSPSIEVLESKIKLLREYSNK